MSRKFALAALAAAALTAGPMFATEATAKDGRRTNAAIGIAAGIGGLLIGSAIANAQPRYQAQPGYYAQPRGYGHVAYGSDRYDDDEPRYYDVGYGGGSRHYVQPGYYARQQVALPPCPRYHNRPMPTGARVVCR